MVNKRIIWLINNIVIQTLFIKKVNTITLIFLLNLLSLIYFNGSTYVCIKLKFHQLLKLRKLLKVLFKSGPKQNKINVI